MSFDTQGAAATAHHRSTGQTRSNTSPDLLDNPNELAKPLVRADTSEWHGRAKSFIERENLSACSSSMRSAPSRKFSMGYGDKRVGESRVSANHEEKKSKMLWEEIKESPAAIMAHTAEFDALLRLPFCATMLDPSSAAEAMSQDAAYHAWVAVQKVVDAIPRGTRMTEIKLEYCALQAMKEYRAELGIALRDAVTGSHLTFIDPTYKDADSKSIIEEAKSLAACFDARGLPREELVVSIPATEAGIQAAKVLTTSKIFTNLTHVSSLIHAAICVEAGATIITFCCEPMLVAHKALYKTQMDKVRPRDHPCIQEIQATVEYFKVNKISSKIVVSSFCGTPSIEPLKGIHCIALRSAEIDEVLERGAPFTAPPADSMHCLRGRQAQYPPRYTTSGAYFSGMSASNRSMAKTTLSEGLREMLCAWRQMITKLSADIRQSVQIRDACFRDFTRPYEDDLRMAKLLITAYLADDEEAMKVAMSSRRRPRRDDIGFRMCTITWGENPVCLDIEALIYSDENISKKTTPTDGSSSTKEENTCARSAPLDSGATRNTHDSRLSQSSKSEAGRGRPNKIRLQGRYLEEEEVF